MHFHMLGAWQTFLLPQARTWRDRMLRILLLEQRCFEQVSSLKYLMGRVRKWQIYEVLWDQELQEEVEILFLEHGRWPRMELRLRVETEGWKTSLPIASAFSEKSKVDHLLRVKGLWIYPFCDHLLVPNTFLRMQFRSQQLLHISVHFIF